MKKLQKNINIKGGKMNAYELADKMDYGKYDWADEVAKMLRRQAKRIEELESKVTDLMLYMDEKALRKMCIERAINERDLWLERAD
jgi:hypothetical protein